MKMPRRTTRKIFSQCLKTISPLWLTTTKASPSLMSASRTKTAVIPSRVCRRQKHQLPLEKSDGGVRYMYLQVNPITWFLGLSGIILSLILIIGRVFFKTPIKNKNLFYLITAFATLYLIYMAIMLRIERVMYLYHYFILLFSFHSGIFGLQLYF